MSPTKKKSAKKPAGKWTGKISRIWWKAVFYFFAVTLSLVVIFRFVPVPVTPLMLIRCVEQLQAGKKMQLKHTWVPIDAISKELALAVICSEDQNFMTHFGLDVQAIERSIEASKNGVKRLRGASTITQQTAKNVFLWPSRSWVRKGFEVYFTFLIELLWSKKRILEIYLNSIEMGNGIYGAEAASRHYFHKSARNLTRAQAAAIAAVLPNPRVYSANPPGPYVQGRIRWILGQMNHLQGLKIE